MTTEHRLPPVLQLVNPVAERAIVVGDPGRALELAQSLLDKPLMSNHQRGLWGYSGAAADGAALTIQSTGTGGPSVAAVVRELHDAGVRRMVRAGSAAALRPGAVGVDEQRSVAFAVPADGTSRALAAPPRLRPDAAMTQALRDAGVGAIGVLSVDLLPQDGGLLPAAPADVAAVDRQTAPFLAACARLAIPAAAVLAFPGPDTDEDRRREWWRTLGDVAVTALHRGSADG